MRINREGIHITWLGLVTCSFISLLGFWTGKALESGTLLSPLLWSVWSALMAVSFVGSLKWQMSGLMSLSSKPMWPVVLTAVGCLTSIGLLIASLAG